MEGCDKRSCEELDNGTEGSVEDAEVQLVVTGTDCGGHVVLLLKEGIGEFVTMKVASVNVATLDELSNAEAERLLFVAIKISIII